MIQQKKIEDILIKIGVPASVKGFKYIIDAVQILSDDMGIGFTKELYPQIAEMNNTSGTRVERAIRNALNASRKKGNIDDVDYYIGFLNCKNSSSLKMLCRRIRNEINEEQEPIVRIDEKIIRKIIREELMYVMGINPKMIARK